MSEDRNESNETSSDNTEIDTTKMDGLKQKKSLEVTNAVKEVLEQLAAGELFTLWGLEENSLESLATPEIDGADGSDATAESFKAFTKAVATQILKNKGGPESLPKKKRKKILTEVQQRTDHIKEEIRHFIRFRKNCVEDQGNEHLMVEQHGESHMKGQEGSTDVLQKQSDQLDVDPDDDNSEDSGSSKLRRKFKKSKKEKSSKKDQKKNKSAPKDVRADDSEIQQQFESQAIESVEAAENDDQSPGEHSPFYQQFEEDKKRVLSRVPEHVKKRFRQISFTKWNKVCLPVLEISPYDVEPGAVRDQWMTMFEKTRKANRPPTRLIFWYGTTWEDRSEAYSFLPKNKLKGLEESLDLGYGELPPSIKKKIDSGKSLTGPETFHLRALQQFDIDKELPPEDRIKWMMQFEEDYVYQERYFSNQNENGSVPQELADLPPPAQSAETILEPEHNTLSPTNEESKPSISKKKHKKNKKTKQEKTEFIEYKKEDFDDSVESEDKDNDDDYIETSTKSKKRKRNSTKNNKDASGKKKKKKETEETPIKKKKIGRSSDDEKSIHSEKDEKSIHSEKSDKKIKKKKKGKSDDEKSTHSEKDERSTHSGKSDKKRGKKRKNKETKVKSSKDKKVKESSDTDPESSTKIDDKSHQEEQHRFEECEKVILPIMSLMEKAISKNDANIAEQSLKQLKSKASVITAPFIEHYKPQNTVKVLRNTMKENNHKISSLGKEVFNELKVVYSAMKNSVPEGFTPRLTKVKKESETKNETLDLEKKRAKVTPSPKNQEEHNSYPSHADIPLQSQTKSKEKNAVKSESIDTSSNSLSLKKKSVSPVPKTEDVPKDMPLKDNASLTKANGSSHHNESHNNKSIPKRPAPTPPPLPPPRKAFSLRGMLDGSKPTPTPKAKDSSHKDSNNTPHNGTKTPSRQTSQQFPKWSTSSDSIPPTDPDRLFAIDFLTEAVSTSFGTLPHFIISEASLVQSLEAATHTWSSTRKRALDDYWGKIHDLTAAITGKNGKGALVKLITEGKYNSPMDVVKLNRMNLHNAFEGRSID